MSGPPQQRALRRLARSHPQTPIRLGGRQQRVIHTLGLLLLGSGAGWLLFEHFVRVEAEFGPVHHDLQPWLLKLHGVVAMLAIWGFGVLWIFHIRRAWQLRRRRRSGGALFAAIALLSVTGLLLYYAGDERLRSAISLVHWLLGFAGSGALLVHAFTAPPQMRDD